MPHLFLGVDSDFEGSIFAIYIFTGTNIFDTIELPK